MSTSPPRICPTCHGKKVIVRRRGDFEVHSTCGTCNGKGWIK